MVQQLVKMKNFALFISKRLNAKAVLDCRTSRAENWADGSEEWAKLERELFTLLGWFGFKLEIKHEPVYYAKPGTRLETGGMLRRDDE